MERRQRQKVLLFDTDQVIQLLEQRSVRDYLATMLASFTRVESVTVGVRVREGNTPGGACSESSNPRPFMSPSVMPMTGEEMCL